MESSSTAHVASLRDAWRRVNDRIDAAAQRSGRRRSDVLLVAVTKNAAPEEIRAVVDLGQTDLAENRVQHLIQRAAMLDEFLSRRRELPGAAPGLSVSEAPDAVRWHMIGHLQRNKIKQAAPLVKLIHSVDSLRLAEELQTLGNRLDATYDVLLQVNTSGEASKFGVTSPAAPYLAEQIDTMVHLRLRGVMTIAPHSDDPEQSRGTFVRTRELFEEMRHDGLGGRDFNILSMGMSGDFEVAIEEGANLVRIGRALFGETES